MLQLNSYRNERYWRWINQDSIRFMHFGPLLPLASLLLWPFVSPETMVFIWSIAFIFLLVTRDTTPQKKKTCYN